MRKKLGKLVWWLPVANAALVGFILYVINGMRLEAVAGQESLIGVGIVGYAILIIALPVDLTSSGKQSDDTKMGRSK